MKLSWFPLIFLALVPLPGALADAQKVCQGKGFRTCFQLLLQERCLTYAKGNLLSKREYFCEMSAVRMMELFDPFQSKDDPYNVVAFPRKIGELITNPKSLAYLSDLPAAIEKSIADGQLFSLWDYTLARTGGDEDRALEWIAVLFQDTQIDRNNILTRSRVHFGQKKKERALTPKELKIWEEAIHAVSYDRLVDDSEESDAIFLSVFPGIDPTNLSAGMYHFYFAAHLARSIQKARGSTTPQGIDMNGFAPFLLNTLYEMHVDLNPENDLSPLDDAKPFDPATMQHSLRDIYSGYLGALYGLGGAKLVTKAESFDSLSKRFAKNPRETIRSLYRNFRPAVPAPKKK